MKFCPFLVAGRDSVLEHADHEQILDAQPDSLGIPEEELDAAPRHEDNPEISAQEAKSRSTRAAGEAGAAANLECLGERCRFYAAGDCRFDRLFASGPAPHANLSDPVAGVQPDGEQPSLGYVLQEVWSLQRESLRELIDGFRKVEDVTSDKQGDLGQQLENISARLEEVQNAGPHPEVVRILESRFENVESCVGKLEAAMRGALGESDSSLQSQLDETRQAMRTAVDESRRALQESFMEAAASVANEARSVVGEAVAASSAESRQVVQDVASETQQAVQGVSDAVRDVRGDIADVRGNIGEMSSAMGQLRDDVSQVRGDVGAVESHVKAVHGSVGDMQKDVGQVRDAVDGVQGDVASVHGALVDMRDDMGRVRDDLGGVRDDLGSVRDGVQEAKQSTSAIHLKTQEIHKQAGELDQRTKDLQGQTQQSHKKVVDVLQTTQGMQEGVREVSACVRKIQEGMGSMQGDVQTAVERTLGKLHDSLQETRNTLQEMLKSAGAESRAELERSLSRVLDDNRQMRELRDQVERALDSLKTDVQGVASAAAKLETSSVETQQLLNDQRQHNRDLESRERREEARRLNNAGVMSYHQGAYDTSVDQFRKALDMDPTLAEAWNNLGLAQTEMKKDDEALESFKKALEIDPSVGQIYNNLGYLYHRRGELGEAIEMYERATQRSSDTSAAYSNLANALYQMDRVEDAVGAWKHALEIDPANDKASAALERLGMGSE